MTIFPAVLVLATFLCSLVTGLLFAFAAVVMPGLRSLDDGDFIRAFQAIDRVIQNKQPLFVLVGCEQGLRCAVNDGPGIEPDAAW